MATITKGAGNGTLTTKCPPSNCRVGGGYAATDIPASTPCYFGTDGRINISSGAAANAAAAVDGWTLEDVKAGEFTTLYTDCNLGYGKGNDVAPGTSYYLGTAGVLSDIATTGGTRVIARGVPDNNITGAKEHKLRVRQSY